jgi:hypothetical protein
VPGPWRFQQVMISRRLQVSDMPDRDTAPARVAPAPRVAGSKASVQRLEPPPAGQGVTRLISVHLGHRAVTRRPEKREKNVSPTGVLRR